ncbi:MAG TPA: winged helix-turn-helix domain-containing protein [Pyrinomonadaceae bacterium]|nr:winged helix-turn-helix domain-containing protein [Pyrinomonadaceae bacterium]
MPNPNIRINPRSGETKTAQIFNQLASAILAGKFSAGDLITSERELAERLGVSRNIVRNAYRRLEEAGLIETSSTSNRRVRASGEQRAHGVAGVDREDSLAEQRGRAGGKGGGGGVSANRRAGRGGV